MNEFRPLRDASSSEFERALLRSANRDVPSPRALGRTAAALGVTTLMSTTAGAAASAASSAGAATFWTLAVKPLLIGAGSGLVVATGAYQLSGPVSPARAPESAPVASPASPPPRAPARKPAGEHELPPPLPSVSGANQGAAPLALNPVSDLPNTPEVPRDASGKSRADFDAASIAGQVASVDRARQALRSGRPREALAELDRYRQSWPSGVLTTEVRVLRVEANLALGDRASAVRDARAFLDSDPAARYADRVRGLFKPSEL